MSFFVVRIRRLSNNQQALYLLSVNLILNHAWCRHLIINNWCYPILRHYSSILPQKNLFSIAEVSLVNDIQCSTNVDLSRVNLHLDTFPQTFDLVKNHLLLLLLLRDVVIHFLLEYFGWLREPSQRVRMLLHMPLETKTLSNKKLVNYKKGKL
mgnify:CR=1 FL=1